LKTLAALPAVHCPNAVELTLPASQLMEELSATHFAWLRATEPNVHRIQVSLEREPKTVSRIIPILVLNGQGPSKLRMGESPSKLQALLFLFALSYK
jgi:hypothetical protein